jgi:ribokinase
MKHNNSIVVVGSSNTDMIVRVERLPRPGETVLGGQFLSAAGGKGANQAVAASRAGGQVAFIGRVGCDSLGESALSGLAEAEVDVTHVVRDARAPSGAALIFVAKNGENSIAVAGGANERLSVADLKKAGSVLRGAKVILMQLETPLPTVTLAAKIAASTGAIAILNPAPARELSNRLLQTISILTPNKTEAELLAGVRINSIRHAENAARILQRRGARTVIITLGDQGAFVAAPTGSQHIPGHRVKPVDTTGAGDVFNGALAVALANDDPLPAAVHFANAAAALSVTRLGAQPSAPKRREIQKLMASRR